MTNAFVQNALLVLAATTSLLGAPTLVSAQTASHACGKASAAPPFLETPMLAMTLESCVANLPRRLSLWTRTLSRDRGFVAGDGMQLLDLQ